ncbi:MAG: glycosyltransferase family 2 protein [Candidatus Moraniibacteriota bacterium]|jgi:GT2 family glycosyltransferase
MKNAIIIVNYNKEELLEKCLASVFLMNHDNFDVIVVDNGSEDSSIQIMQEKFEDVMVVAMGYNSGFCKANNVGIQKAIDKGSENIILLNNDTEVAPKFLTELIDGIDKNKSIEMVAPKVLFYNEKNKIDSTGLQISSDGMAVNRLLNEQSKMANEKCEVFCPTGAAALFTARLLNDIKQDGMFFDEDYEYYFEDLDMGWRARLRGWRCMYMPEAVVYHHKNATSGGYSEFIAFYTNRNLFYNIIKNYPFVYFCRAILLSFIRYPYLLVLSFFKKGTVSKFRKNISIKDLAIVTIRGIWDVGINLRKLLRKRTSIQKGKTVRDISSWFDEYGINFFKSKKK